MQIYSCHRRTHRRGGTLIDVAIGSMLLTLLLIPSVRWIGQAETLNRRLQQREEMLFEAENLIDTLKVKMCDAATFDSTYSRSIDDLSKVSAPSGNVYIARQRLYADESIAEKLLVIEVDVWQDDDRDGQVDASETAESLRTQWAAP